MSLAAQWDYTDTVRVRVPAKINLALRVGSRRHDGYHELATIFQAVSLYDEVRAEWADSGIACSVGGTDAHQIGPENENLAFRAAQLLQREYSVSAGARLTIDKRIPVAGGMAGGSADAAAALLACARLWELEASLDDLMELGSRLGSDVPFLLMGGCAVGLGRGESLTPMLSRGLYHWVLAFSRQGLSTPAVYRQFDRLAAQSGPGMTDGGRSVASAPAKPGMPRDLMMALTAGDVPRVGGFLVNDLQASACSMMPVLSTLLRAGRTASCLGAIVSGSGPTIAFLTADEQAATDLAVSLSSQGVAHQVRLATGPVPGASVVEG
uniref:4-(cytidine 5'-diphospho)-2-C-methyl-D-erythritol kinase n=1 Tax=termite gut metagenome TaxID=433724 RepID=S0DGM0_9ZZZZ